MKTKLVWGGVASCHRGDERWIVWGLPDFPHFVPGGWEEIELKLHLAGAALH
ncbi:MAG: hypothetical protein QF721_07205 [Verrucomicrobiota bacterium]|nr:hypothetical protein [Verrucomicrobiota bacterium]MDP7049222.1 hypothetical protein [Verrucomicrobiota bacterium]